MDQTTALNALSKLLTQYPDISTAVVADVFEACDQNPVRAYDTLCDMVIPAQVQAFDGMTVTTAAERPVIVHSRARKPSPPRVSRSITYASTTPHLPLVNNGFSFASPPLLRGAWANANMGRRYRVEHLCQQYEWLDPKVANDLFEKYGDCIELVENDVLEMFPVDEPSVFATVNPAPICQQPTTVNLSNGRSSSNMDRTVTSVTQTDTETELRRVAQPQPEISLSSPSMKELRQKVWEKRIIALRVNALAQQTRKPNIIADARKKTDEMYELSAYFLERIRQSREYRSGCIDLHGLTKDESIQLVDWKLSESNRHRFRLITGKGNNSLNGQAVLRPALERYLRGRRITFSSCQDGIITVTP